MLGKGGFKLSKWNAYHPQLRETVQGSAKEFHSRGTSSKHPVKVLGMYWNSNENYFHFIILQYRMKSFTKFTLFSEISGLFDPLGFVGPVILTAKICLQSL